MYITNVLLCLTASTMNDTALSEVNSKFRYSGHFLGYLVSLVSTST